MKLLDTTLRDGSYVIDFQFSKEETSVLVERLERVGFELIEVGHGRGLGASRQKNTCIRDGRGLYGCVSDRNL